MKMYGFEAFQDIFMFTKSLHTVSIFFTICIIYLIQFMSENFISRKSEKIKVEKKKRKFNGCSFPLDKYQVLFWAGYFLLLLGFIITILPFLRGTVRTVILTSYLVFYIVGVITVLIVMLVDTADEEFKKPEEDSRAIFNHAIQTRKQPLNKYNDLCEKCSMVVDPKCTHCDDCRKCVYEMHHHNPYYNCCISEKNYNVFVVSYICEIAVALLHFCVQLYLLIQTFTNNEFFVLIQNSFFQNKSKFLGYSIFVLIVCSGILIILIAGIFIAIDQVLKERKKER